ncbi:MAG: cupin domain-containing protein [Bacteroidetes bacterium]|nr:cupin domain-containing protein [Bacteroidota bacterium]
MLVSKNELNHYNWGNNCDGWCLLDTNELSVIEELMLPGTVETMHYHKKATQLFYILTGEATFTIDNKVLVSKQGECIKILPNQIHKIENNSFADLRFLLVSQPKAQQDRFEITI